MLSALKCSLPVTVTVPIAACDTCSLTTPPRSSCSGTETRTVV
jgi:hypothetical protein